MNTARPSMRLVTDEASDLDKLSLPLHQPAAQPVLNHLDDVQSQIQSLQTELEMLRRRDETLRFYMHRLDEEQRLAARIQQDFLPKILPQVGPVHFHTLFRPAGYVSGDLYDIMRLDEHHVGFFICDAVGHGMPAALLTMFIKRALTTKEIQPQGYRILDPGDALARLNQSLIEQNLSQATYATALYGVIDTRTLKVCFAKAGHPSPALLRADGKLEFFDSVGPLLGIFPEELFTMCEIQLAPGDRLFIYSDGIEVGFCGENIADNLRWQQELQSRAALSTPELLQGISEELDRQSGSLQPKDDVTLIAIEIK